MAYQSFKTMTMPMVMIMIILVALFAQRAESRGNNINPFCRTSDYKDLCNAMVRGAINWHDATRNAVDSALGVAIDLQKMAPMLDQAVANLPPQSKQSLLSTCRDNFDGAVDDYKRGLDLLERNDIGGLNTHLSAVSASDCTDAFAQFGSVMPAPVADKINLLNQEADNCLAVSQQN